VIPWVVVAAGLGMAWGLDEFSKPTPTLVHTPIGRRPSGPEWRLEHQPYAWPRTESGRRSFTRYLARKLIEQELLPPQAVALFIAHTARETGYGSAVWWNNFGNEKQYWKGPWFNLAGQPYIAFETPEHGLAHAVNRIRRQWPRPFAKMLAGDLTWYGDLGIAGYYENGRTSPPSRHTAETIGPTQAEYNGTVEHVRRLLRT